MQEHSNTAERTCQVRASDFKGTRMRVSQQGAYGEGLSMEKAVRPNVRKINANEYEILATGEVKEYKKNGEKGGKSLRQTMNRLQALIRTNFTQGSKAQAFVTLTYRENMREPEKLYNDFKTFWLRLKYAYPEKQLEYLSVAEPQERGAWHLHVMLKDTTGKALYIDNKDLERIWGHGMTDIQRLRGDDVGKYYVTYFSCIQSNKDDIAEEGKRSKKAQKTDRLKYYPIGFRFYRKSKGIREPQVKEMSRKEFEREYVQLTSEKSYDIVGENGEIINRIDRELRKRK